MDKTSHAEPHRWLPIPARQQDVSANASKSRSAPSKSPLQIEIEIGIGIEKGSVGEVLTDCADLDCYTDTDSDSDFDQNRSSV
jgi:hypothetical protein